MGNMMVMHLSANTTKKKSREFIYIHRKKYYKRLVLLSRGNRSNIRTFHGFISYHLSMHNVDINNVTFLVPVMASDGTRRSACTQCTLPVSSEASRECLFTISWKALERGNKIQPLVKCRKTCRSIYISFIFLIFC